MEEFNPVPGAPLTIYYNPNKPSDSVIEKGASEIYTWIFWTFSTVLILPYFIARRMRKTAVREILAQHRAAGGHPPAAGDASATAHTTTPHPSATPPAPETASPLAGKNAGPSSTTATVSPPSTTPDKVLKKE